MIEISAIELTLGMDIELESGFIFYSSENDYASIVDADTGELLYYERIN